MKFCPQVQFAKNGMGGHPRCFFKRYLGSARDPPPLVIILLDLSCVPPTYTQLPPPLRNPHATITQTKKRNNVNADEERTKVLPSPSAC